MNFTCDQHNHMATCRYGGQGQALPYMPQRSIDLQDLRKIHMGITMEICAEVDLVIDYCLYSVFPGVQGEGLG